ncbi:hypothetical protein [Nocardia sp. CS682]|uniref:hypothetical protein n=1 Tax=Nocardia sp. CS682 TaxID=1047172 RepID=UPI00107505D8|nr:hypothetical protein [Nocardia sp. CS682]
MASDSVRPKQNEVAPWASARTSHLASLSTDDVAVDGSPSAGAGDGRVYNFHGMTATSSGQQLARIFAGRELVESARPIANSVAAVPDSAPFQATDGQPAGPAPGPVVITGAKPIGFDKGLGSPGPTTQEESDRLQAEIDANDRRIRENNQPKLPPPPAPATTTPPAVSVPSSLEELAVPGPDAGPTPDQEAPQQSGPPALGNDRPNANQPEAKAPTAFEQIYGGIDGSAPTPVPASVPSLPELAAPGYQSPRVVEHTATGEVIVVQSDGSTVRVDPRNPMFGLLFGGLVNPDGSVPASRNVPSDQQTAGPGALGKDFLGLIIAIGNGRDGRFALPGGGEFTRSLVNTPAGWKTLYDVTFADGDKMSWANDGIRVGWQNNEGDHVTKAPLGDTQRSALAEAVRLRDAQLQAEEAYSRAYGADASKSRNPADVAALAEAQRRVDMLSLLQGDPNALIKITTRDDGTYRQISLTDAHGVERVITAIDDLFAPGKLFEFYRHPDGTLTDRDGNQLISVDGMQLHIGKDGKAIIPPNPAAEHPELYNSAQLPMTHGEVNVSAVRYAGGKRPPFSSDGTGEFVKLPQSELYAELTRIPVPEGISATAMYKVEGGGIIVEDQNGKRWATDPGKAKTVGDELLGILLELELMAAGEGVGWVVGKGIAAGVRVVGRAIARSGTEAAAETAASATKVGDEVVGKGGTRTGTETADGATTPRAVDGEHASPPSPVRPERQGELEIETQLDEAVNPPPVDRSGQSVGTGSNAGGRPGTDGPQRAGPAQRVDIPAPPSPTSNAAARQDDATFNRLIEANKGIRNEPIIRADEDPVNGAKSDVRRSWTKKTLSNSETTGTVNEAQYNQKFAASSGEPRGLKGTPGQHLSQLPPPGRRIFKTEIVGHDRAFDSEPKILEDLTRDILRSSSGKTVAEVEEAIGHAINRAEKNSRGLPADPKAVVDDAAHQLGADLSKVDLEVKMVIDYPRGRTLQPPRDQICASCQQVLIDFKNAFGGKVKITARNLHDVTLWGIHE